ncbi:unnamed protein product [Allacma fusca]|uniref:Uncharacterized protein n=1 Tax=Allacma fusca TaxID=39272 RepID=A0A8J2PE21_9HEXA|nr:unnamed protein product [Allacma fusca]
MTLTFQDVLNDAKKLSTKLKDHETAAEALVSQMQAVYQQVEAMKQYNDDIAQLNDLASERPRLALVAGIQQENKHIMELQQENRELRGALEEQQNAIDLIMSKYRQHVSKLTQCQKFDLQLLMSIDTNTKVIESSAEKLNEMKYIMRKAVSSDEEAIVREEELISRLWAENKGLRELLQISTKYGSWNDSVKNSAAETEDKEVQTEESETADVKSEPDADQKL